MTPLLMLKIIIGIVVVAFFWGVALSFCKAAARGDRMRGKE